MRSNDLFLTCT